MSLPLTHAGLSAPGISAALDLKFASTLSLTSSSGITPSYSRASTGTYFNSSGVLTSAAINAPRFDHTYNGTSWISRGLLVEEQRTNVVLNSADFTSGWTTANVAMATSSGTSPDGTNTAVKLYPTTSTTQTRIYRSSTQSCISVFAKAAEKQFVYFYDRPGVNVCWFNLSTGAIGTNATSLSASISNCGNGWFRCSLAASSGSFSFFQIGVSDADGSTSSTASGTNGILIWGAQEEAGSFATSYIPTTSASTTRSADVCQITGADFSSFWNASEGSFACEVNPLGGNVISNQGIVTANDGTFANVMGQIRNLQNTVGDYGAFCRASGTTTMSTVRAAGSTQVGVTFQAATGFKANDCADSLNGGAVITDSTVTIPTVNRLTIGDFHTGANTFLNGHIARLRYFNKRLTDKQLEDLCRPEDQLKLDLKFSENLSLTPVVGPTPSFSRASTGTYFNSSGVLTSAAINAPRFDHTYNGTSWISKGLLIEEQRTNYVKYANNLSTNWANESGATREYNSIVSPDGSNNATKVNVTTGSFSGLYQFPLSNGGSGTYTYSIFAKMGTKSWLWILNVSGSGGSGTFFNISSGTIGTVNSGYSATITNVGNGWYRCTLTTPSAVTPSWFQFGFSDADNSYNAASSGYSYVYGAQVELGAFATSYISNNTGGSVTRSADVCQITGAAFSGFWNATEGSAVCEADTFSSPSSVSRYYHFDDTATGNQNIGSVTLDATGSIGGDYVYNFAYNGSIQAAFAVQPARPFAKSAFAWRVNDFASSTNGGSVSTDSSGAIPSGINRVTLGANSSSGQILNGHISRLRYYAIRLPNRLLIAKSQ